MKQGPIQLWLLALFTLLGGIISAPSGYAKAKADVEIAEQLDTSSSCQFELQAGKKRPVSEHYKPLENYLASTADSDLTLLLAYNIQDELQFQLQTY
ncbi:MAG: hypothetical protein OQK04_18595, partial [Kangiellaceae bacterium]|nr:hypothetical protein [Kangiellaceae bacterium]